MYQQTGSCRNSRRLLDGLRGQQWSSLLDFGSLGDGDDSSLLRDRCGDGSLSNGCSGLGGGGSGSLLGGGGGHSSSGSDLKEQLVNGLNITQDTSTHLLILLLLLLGALGSLHLLLSLLLAVLEGSEELGQETRALGALILLRLNLKLSR